MKARDAVSAGAPADQADGLRRLFAAARAHAIPVAGNPHAPHAAVALERLCAALGELGRHTLLVDATEAAPPARELATDGLAEGVETLAPTLSYLAAHGLPARYADARGAAGGLLAALADAAPQAEAIVVHAAAPELCRVFAGRAVRPVLLAHDHPRAVTHAYASLKLLATRGGWMTHDLLLTAAPDSPRAARIAAQLSGCADAYFGAVLHGWARVDPASGAGDATADDLRRLVRAQLAAGAAPAAPPAGARAAPRARAAEAILS